MWALHYDLIPLQVVERLEFQGLLGLPRNQLREAIAERYGQNPRVDRADEAVQALTNLYRDHGYLNARVAIQVEPSPERDTMVFEINAGPRVRIGTIELRGAPLQPPAQLLARLNLREGEIYDRDAIERRLADYEDELRNRRHYEAELDHTIAVRGDGLSVDLTLRVEPGPRVTVAFDGDPLLARDRAELVPIAREGSGRRGSARRPPAGGLRRTCLRKATGRHRYHITGRWLVTNSRSCSASRTALATRSRTWRSSATRP